VISTLVSVSAVPAEANSRLAPAVVGGGSTLVSVRATPEDSASRAEPPVGLEIVPAVLVVEVTGASEVSAVGADVTTVVVVPTGYVTMLPTDANVVPPRNVIPNVIR
jgi:hypothetical protein